MCLPQVCTSCRWWGCCSKLLPPHRRSRRLARLLADVRRADGRGGPLELFLQPVPLLLRMLRQVLHVARVVLGAGMRVALEDLAQELVEMRRVLLPPLQLGRHVSDRDLGGVPDKEAQRLVRVQLDQRPHEPAHGCAEQYRRLEETFGPGIAGLSGLCLADEVDDA